MKERKKILWKILPYIIKYYGSNWKEAFWEAATTNWMALYFACYWIVLPSGGTIEEGITAVLSYYGLLLPLILGSIHAVMFPNRLDKTMFLCPMGYQERILFLVFGYWFRFGCVCLVSMLMIFFMTAIGLLQASIYLLVFFLCEAMFAAIVFLMTYTEDSQKNGDSAWMYAGCLMSMISCLFFGNVAWEYSNKDLEGWENGVMIILFLIQMLLFLKVMTRCWKREMAIAADYERNFLFRQDKTAK